jgi:pimeloyl-ACP methyl ester carboxylesterase
LLIALVGLAGYAAIAVLVWWLQDRLVFPGAGRGDRGVPSAWPPVVVEWLGPAGERTRIATLATAAPQAVVLYFGGNGEDLTLAIQSALELHAHGVEVLAVEPPGYGASAGTPSVASWLAMAERAADHGRQRAQALGKPLAAVGSSLGSFAAVHLAANARVDALLLRAPPHRLVDLAAAQFPWLPVRWLLRHQFDNLTPAPRVACPTLVVHGDGDRLVPDGCGRAVAAAVPQATFVSVPGFGHNDLSLAPRGPVGAAVRQLLTGR